MNKWHKDGAIPDSSWVWVFGSNLATNNGAGAALVAVKEFKRPRYELDDVYVPFYEKDNYASYGIPTKDVFLKTLSFEKVKQNIQHFVDFVLENRDKKFFVTRVGCGFAGNLDSSIAPLFSKLTELENVSLPYDWMIYYDEKHKT